LLGTSSGAGKSLMTAALCRVLRRQGETPLPFKGQNMSNNAWVDQAGGEMAYSQALQSWAAGLEPACAMNPVLLKPQGDSTSEVIHLGQSVGNCRAEHYYRDWFRPGWAAIRQGLGELQAAHPGGRSGAGGGRQPGGSEPAAARSHQPASGAIPAGPLHPGGRYSSAAACSPSWWAPWRCCGRWSVR